MAKRTKLWVAGALLLAVSGAAVASNMGFKFVPNLNQTNKTFTVSLPLNQNYANASAVFNDSPPRTACTASAVWLSKVASGSDGAEGAGAGAVAEGFTARSLRSARAAPARAPH